MLKSLRKWFRDAFDESEKNAKAWEEAEAKAAARLGAMQKKARQVGSECLPMPKRRFYPTGPRGSCSG